MNKNISSATVPPKLYNANAAGMLNSVQAYCTRYYVIFRVEHSQVTDLIGILRFDDPIIPDTRPG